MGSHSAVYVVEDRREGVKKILSVIYLSNYLINRLG
jgi:hypothetical protein